MGTRSLTIVKDGSDSVVTMYRQMDGYPSGHGQELADFLKPIRIVNGIPCNESDRPIANGMGCLAAQIVAHFKEGVGSIYLMKGKNHGEDYIYEVTGGENKPIMMTVKTSENRLIWRGYAADFNGKMIEAREEATTC